MDHQTGQIWLSLVYSAWLSSGELSVMQLDLECYQRTGLASCWWWQLLQAELNFWLWV